MLSAKRDVSAAKRFFKKMVRADHRRLLFTISVDENAAGMVVSDLPLPIDNFLNTIQKPLNLAGSRAIRFNITTEPGPWSGTSVSF